MKTNNDWQWVGGGYDIAFATTDDPRVVAVIQRDDDASVERCLDGDAIPPIYGIEYRGEYRASHYGGYRDDEFAQRLVYARSQFQYAAGYRYDGLSYDMIAKSTKMLRRWARIFHGAVFEFTVHQGDEWVVFSNDAFRDHLGEEEFDIEREQSGIEGMVKELTCVLDGDVYGIGFATNSGRVLDGDPIDLDDLEWLIEIECWGFICEEYAKTSAAVFEAGEPNMEPMLELPTGHEPDHTDRLADASILDARLNEN